MPNNQTKETDIDKQHRTMLVLWVAFLMSIAVYLFISVVAPKPEEPANRLLVIIFSAASVFLTLVSFAVKQKFLSQSIEQQDPQLVAKGFIVASAICEAGALMGLVDFFIAKDRNYWLLIAAAMMGLLLHFPRRSHLEAASFKKGSQSN